MAILTQDIKLLKAAVMADTTDGGGQMTGIEVIDGQSNNLFPDTSSMDRALGRVNMRKVFGVAHTPDRDTLMGAHAIIIEAPADPLVHCALLKTVGWSDERSAARETLEKYLVKGPRLASRIYETHYAGSMQVRLISFVEADFPNGGDAIVLRNPDGIEQYVRLLKVTTAKQSVAVVETMNNQTTTLVLDALVATCDIGVGLAYDVLGPPATRILSNESAYAIVYSTTFAGGAKFYGVKPLGVNGTTGDYAVTTAGGIFTPIVPAATIETPSIDNYPFAPRTTLNFTGVATVTVTGSGQSITAGAKLTAPSPITPKTVSIVAGGTTFTDTGEGILVQGVTSVGTVNYVTGVVEWSATSPNYGYQSTAFSFKPATLTTATAHTASLKITIANQGLAFTQVLVPPPGPGSVSLSYLAQGRWYTLRDNLNGKLSGGDNGYGIGTINYVTGSINLTLGAIPDIDSHILYDWGDAHSATPVASTSKLFTVLTPDHNVTLAGVTLTWTTNGTNYTATSDSFGVITGDAEGSVQGGKIEFAPNVFPSSVVHVAYTGTLVTTPQSGITSNGSGFYTLLSLPMVEGSLVAAITLGASPDRWYRFSEQNCKVYDRAGVLYVKYTNFQGQHELAIGTINYTTGAVFMPIALTVTAQDTWNWTNNSGTPIVVSTTPLSTIYYAVGSSASYTQDITPGVYTMATPNSGGSMVSTSPMFDVGGVLYTATAGGINKGWDAKTGTPTVAAGTSASDGKITLTSLPANFSNSVVWSNLADDQSPGMITSGVFRAGTAPLKTGVFQLQSPIIIDEVPGTRIGNGNDAGVISGTITGTVDYTRGIVYFETVDPINAVDLSYNAVFLAYLPIDQTLLGIDTSRLPLDGKVPIYRTGDLVIVHNTVSTALVNPVVKDTPYDMGRVRLSSVRIKDSLGVVLPDTLYTVALNAGTVTVPLASNITAYTQPFTVEHRIEDMLLCASADISGQLKFTRSLTHNFPMTTSFVSSAMPFGDLFARTYNFIEQSTWTNVWSNTMLGSQINANFNEALYPIVVTNAGAIKERWALIFTSAIAFNIVGESVGIIGTGSTSVTCAPPNPATGVPYFSIPPLGWGIGWAVGNVLRFNTDACGAPFWPVRTVLQGPASLDSDKFTIAFRGDVDRA